MVEPPRLYQNKWQGGFTLIEMSIVLVIIGLIIGGVLVGRDLIAASAIRAQISQIEKYNAAVNTFRGKYGYLPGDIPDPYATQYGLASRGATTGEGDGDGVLHGADNYGAPTVAELGYMEGTGETAVFWEDLTATNLIEGLFNTASISIVQGADITGSSLDLYMPVAKIGQRNHIFDWSGGIGVGGLDGGNSINYYGIANVSTIVTAWRGQILSTPGLTVVQAYSIDKKIDDGLPQSGRVLAILVGSGGNIFWAAGGGAAGALPGVAKVGSATTCYDNAGVASSPMAYSVGQSNGTGVNCALSFQFQ